jgi:hypothetical protein
MLLNQKKTNNPNFEETLVVQKRARFVLPLRAGRSAAAGYALTGPTRSDNFGRSA